MNLFKTILNIFRKTKNILLENNEPYLITDSEKDCFVIKSGRGYSVEVRLDDIYMYFKHEKGNFCVKRPLESNNILAIEAFIKSSRIFHLEKSSFNSFMDRFYRGTFTSLRLMELKKSPFIRFNNISYYEANIVTRPFLNDIYKVNLKYKKYTEKDENFYFVHGYFIQMQSLKNFLFSTFVESERSALFRLKKNKINDELNSFESLVSNVIKRIDLDKVNVLFFEHENIVFPFKLNGLNVLLGISKNSTDIKNVHSNKSVFIKKNHIEIINNTLSEDNIDTKFHFIMYSFPNGKLLKQRFVGHKDEIMRMKIDVFTKILNNVNIRLSYPAQEMLMEMLRLDIVEPHESLTQEHIELYEMLKI